MTGVAADVDEAQEKALDVFLEGVKVDRARAMCRFQNLRDYANKLARELAHREAFDAPPEVFMEKALKAREYDDVVKTLYEMTDEYQGAMIDWEFVPADDFVDGYERLEVYVADYALP